MVADRVTVDQLNEATADLVDTAELQSALADKVTATQLVHTLEPYAKSSDVETELDNKQDKLVAGENITIDGNVISAKGGGTSDAYTKAEADALYKAEADS